VVKALALIGVALVAGCGQPTPLQCAAVATCGVAGVCVDGYCAEPDPSCTTGLRYHESAGELAGECTLSGDGSGSAGDGGGSGGGSGEIWKLLDTNVIDASSAKDDVKPSCGVAGGRDVMFDVTITGNQRLYVDTFGTGYGVVLAIYAGTCASLTAASSDVSCVATSCSDYVKQWSELLAAGNYCVVVDDSDPIDPPTQLVVRSKLGPPSPRGVVSAGSVMLNTSSTCTADQLRATCNPDTGGEASWFFMTCGGVNLVADTCDDADYQGYLTAFGLGTAALACVDGCATQAINVPLATPSPLWVVADDIASVACSPVSVYVALQ
jgi:hypothetical protein